MYSTAQLPKIFRQQRSSMDKGMGSLQAFLLFVIHWNLNFYHCLDIRSEHRASESQNNNGDDLSCYSMYLMLDLVCE